MWRPENIGKHFSKKGTPEKLIKHLGNMQNKPADCHVRSWAGGFANYDVTWDAAISGYKKRTIYLVYA
jgi:hypothetical protein